MTELSLLAGELTTQDVDVIVYAGNRHLGPGGGVTGAIGAAAGFPIWDERRERYPNRKL